MSSACIHFINERLTFSRPGDRQPSVVRSEHTPLRPSHGNAVRNQPTNEEDHFQSIDDFPASQDPEIAKILGDHDEHQRQHKENFRRQPSKGITPPRARHFIDPQPDAERITRFDTQASQSQQSRPVAATKRKKVTAEDDGDDVSDDDGFEADDRIVDQSQRRKEAPRVRPSPKKVRIDEPIEATSSHAIVQDEDARVRDYAEQKQIMGSQAARALQAAPRPPRQPMGRSRWGPAEELRLEELISEHGTSWAYLLGLDRDTENMFEGRDQVALKDKARNMKVQMIL